MSDTSGATQQLNAPPSAASADPALNPPAKPVTAADLNPPDVPAALASDPAYLAFLRTMQSQRGLNQNQADEQVSFLKANLDKTLPEIQRRGDMATAATKNAFSQRGTLASSWAGNALTQDATNTAQGLSTAKDAEVAAETGIQQNLAQTQAAQNQALAERGLSTGTALTSAPGTAGAANNTAATPTGGGAASVAGNAIVSLAQRYVGVNSYQWGGGHGPNFVQPGEGGVDCSGLVRSVFGDNGIPISGTAADMQKMGTPVTPTNAQPGDLVFYGNPAYHVGIYIGNGQMISAQDPADGVKVSGIGTPTNMQHVTGTAGAGLPGAAAAPVGPDMTPTTETSPIPGQPDFQVPAALASSPAWLSYKRTMENTERVAGAAEAEKIAAIQAQFGTPDPATGQIRPGTVQNQLAAQLPNRLAATMNTQSQRGTLASSWGQQALTNDRYANAFAQTQADQTGLGQSMAARQALEQGYASDQQKLIDQALLQGQVLASNPTTAGSTANAAATPVAGGAVTRPTSPSDPNGMAAFLAATRQHESGGNYTAANPRGGAYGAYQYIDSTWRAEATAAGYGQYANMHASQAPPQVQDAVAAFNAKQVFARTGDWRIVAENWYYPAWAGTPQANQVPVPGAGNTETVADYGNLIWRMMTGGG